MLQIDDTIISFDLLEKKFACNLTQCKGACCIQGDSGAPLRPDEIQLLQDFYGAIKPYMRDEGIKAIDETGFFFKDQEGEIVTTLVNGGECAFVRFDGGKARCSIESAWMDKKIDFRKPVSCHLYPVRVKEYRNFQAVNYDQWDICKTALIMGEKHDIPLYRYVKDALVRRFGQEWYDQVEFSGENIDLLPHGD